MCLMVIGCCNSMSRGRGVELQQPITIKHTNPSNNLPPIDSNKNTARSRKPLSIRDHVTGDVNDVIHQAAPVMAGVPLSRGLSDESSVHESSFINNCNRSLPPQRLVPAPRGAKKAVQFADDVSRPPLSNGQTDSHMLPDAIAQSLTGSNGMHLSYSMV